MRPFRYAAVLVPLVATGSMSDTFAQANKPSAAFRVERDIQESIFAQSRRPMPAPPRQTPRWWP
jgi:hypothetical protein